MSTRFLERVRLQIEGLRDAEFRKSQHLVNRYAAVTKC